MRNSQGLRNRYSVFLKGFFIFSISFFSFCSQNSENKSQATKTASNHPDTLFSNWLNGHNLSKLQFIDTNESKVCMLWWEPKRLSKQDSNSTWYPSKDSSYYLISNYQLAKQTNRTDEEVQFRFLNTKEKSVYSVFSLRKLNKDIPIPLDNYPTDHYWYDGKTIFLLEKDKEQNSLVLTKYKMEINMLSQFKTKAVKK